VLDDSFLEPSSGVSPLDHLVSSGLPLALLCTLIVLYDRLSAGLRGSVLLALGLFAVVMGLGEAGYYTVVAGPSGDDFTGLLAVPAGALLGSLGAAVLWRSRRKDGPPARRIVRRLLLTLAALAAGYIVLFPLSLAYVFTHSARAHVPQARLGAAYENVTFTARDGVTLRGWYIPSQNGAAVIVAPGRTGSQRPARMLARHGYGVLLFDRRGEGDSDGDPNEFGWNADRDLEGAVKFLRHRADVDRGRIGGLGLSVGAETLLQYAAESDELQAVVSDGAGARSLREDLARPGSGKWGEIPTSVVITLATALFANQLPPPNLKDLVPRIAPRPILFIYGEHDQSNVIDLTPVYYRAARAPKAVWMVPDAPHTDGITTHPGAYERHVLRFLDAALLRRNAPHESTRNPHLDRQVSRLHRNHDR
jgi:fermentation-respiration switch protein FrsA (DUF1100 family)